MSTTKRLAAFAAALLTVSGNLALSQFPPNDAATRPDVSLADAPLEVVAPIAGDGHKGHPSQHYTQEYRTFTQRKLATLRSPILIMQGEETSPLNRWNAETLVPELRAAGKSVNVRSYAGERHCFAYDGRTPDGCQHTAAAASAHRDADEFFRSHFKTQPKSIAAASVKHVPLETR